MKAVIAIWNQMTLSTVHTSSNATLKSRLSSMADGVTYLQFKEESKSSSIIWNLVASRIPMQVYDIHNIQNMVGISSKI